MMAQRLIVHHGKFRTKAIFVKIAFLYLQRLHNDIMTTIILFS